MFFAHRFEARVDIFDWGKYHYTVIYIPQETLSNLPVRDFPRLRISGEINDWPFNGALQPTGQGWYILLSRAFLKRAQLSVGDEVDVRFEVADQDAVDVPQILLDALEEDEKARTLWDRATPGRQRGLVHIINSAKMETTRMKRVAQVIAELHNPNLRRDGRQRNEAKGSRRAN